MSEQTQFSSDHSKTDKTDKTDAVSNTDFLHAVFGENLTEVRPIVVSFEGNPANVPTKAWFGRSWSDIASMLLT